MTSALDDHRGDAPPDWSQGRTVMVGDLFLGLYQPSPETNGFWSGVARGELLFKHCAKCGTHHHPRRMLCSVCGSMDLGWAPSAGRGKVYSFSEVHRAPTPAFQKSVPYTVGLVQTEEGVHWFCRIFAAPGTSIAVDAPVRLEFRVLEQGWRLPVFVLEAP